MLLTTTTLIIAVLFSILVSCIIFLAANKTPILPIAWAAPNLLLYDVKYYRQKNDYIIKMGKSISQNASQQTADELIQHTWHPLYYFNLYRIIISVFFVTSTFYPEALPILGKHNPQLFLITSICYLTISLFCNFIINRQVFRFAILSYSLVCLDIIALTLLMHASGGLDSGLGMLIIVAIAGNSLLSEGKTTFLFAAIASIVILSEHVYSLIIENQNINFTPAGILGISIFATALFAYAISKRLRETELLAEQRGIDLANLADLNEHVIKQIQSGIIVIDGNGHIRLMNESAWHMLGLPSVRLGKKPLAEISEDLATNYKIWLKNNLLESKIFHSQGSRTDILPSFTRLGQDQYSGTLIFLEDASRLAQQAQQMKLASLGRLTASIAHEIRNPLGAISHAEQLLAESAHLDKSEKRLTEIIHNNSKRVNGIIENVLQLSRRGNVTPEKIELNTWLINFKNDFILSLNRKSEELSITVAPDTLEIIFDGIQLHQIIWNLCQNAIRYSEDYPDNPKLELIAGYSEDAKRIHLDIIDHGPGIDPDTASKMFEPFFTTDSKGSGLGLYISRELCENNQASLSFIPIPTGGSCFRIEFQLSK